MQEDKKRKILIASILKPVDDTRMYEKLGLSFLKIPDTSVHIIGFPSSSEVPDSVKCHSLKKFRRISLARIKSRFSVLSLCFRLKPDLFITTTHELLDVGILLKIFLGCRLIYDIQENYYRNILHTNAFPLILRPPIAFAVRLKEIVASLFVDHFFLAERGYEKELDFLPDRKTILENKIKRIQAFATPKNLAASKTIRLIFSGTLAETTGVFTAIELAKKLHDHDARVRLHIIGYAPQNDVLVKIRNQITPCPFIQLTGGDQIVPHAEILSSITQADFGIVSYPPNPATENSIPTKLYEYLGCRLPILLLDHPVWREYSGRYEAAVVFSLQDIEAVAILHQMMHRQFYKHIPDDVFWDSEEEKLLMLIPSILGV